MRPDAHLTDREHCLGLEDVVISVGGSAGVVLPYNNSYIRLNNLFFLGGDNLRGFAVAGVAEREVLIGSRRVDKRAIGRARADWLVTKDKALLKLARRARTVGLQILEPAVATETLRNP